MRARAYFATIFVATAFSYLFGCANHPQSPFANLTPQQAHDLATRLQTQREQALQTDLASAFSNHVPQNVLVLSGGGPDGAFGCGILEGWRQAPNGRPAFDIVTGVSTGAMMATFAFLGEEQDDAALREVYTQTRTQDIHNGPFSARSPDSVFDPAPLQKLIAKYITAETIARVAARHRAGRRLYVATVDLDAGSVVIWPMSKMAAEQGEGCLDRFRQILLAAASVPLVFPPVRIDGDLHVDAGLRESVFLRQSMLGLTHAFDAASASQPAASVPTVWAIINLKLVVPPCAVNDNVLDIGSRCLMLYTQSVEFFSVREVAHVAAMHEPKFVFKYISIGRDLHDSPPTILGPVFDPPAMTKLYEVGISLGRRPESWQQGPPRPDDDPDLRAISAGN